MERQKAIQEMKQTIKTSVDKLGETKKFLNVEVINDIHTTHIHQDIDMLDRMINMTDDEYIALCVAEDDSIAAAEWRWLKLYKTGPWSVS